jgi:protein Mpv17
MILTIAKSPMILLRKYNQALLRSPYKVKMFTAGTTYFLADNICQRYIEKKSSQEYSLDRSCRQSAVGAFFAAPSLHIWHSSILPKIIKPIVGRFRGVLVAVFLNETLLASYFVCCLLFSFAALKKGDLKAGVENVKEKFGSAIVTSMKFWTGISFINYGLIPVHMRPVFVSCWSVVWQSYLSYVANNKLKNTEKKVMVEEYLDDEEEVLLQNHGYFQIL